MPARRRSFVAVVRAAERALHAARVKHVFVGALAVSAYGLPRTTSDVDVIVDYRDRDVPRMVRAFHRRGFRVSEDDLRDARAEGMLGITEDGLHERFCPTCDLGPICEKEHSVGKMSPLCLDGVATAVLRTPG